MGAIDGDDEDGVPGAGVVVVGIGVAVRVGERSGVGAPDEVAVRVGLGVYVGEGELPGTGDHVARCAAGAGFVT